MMSLGLVPAMERVEQKADITDINFSVQLKDEDAEVRLNRPQLLIIKIVVLILKCKRQCMMTSLTVLE